MGTPRDGESIHWSEIDEDLSVEGLLRGTPAPGATSRAAEADGRLLRPQLSSQALGSTERRGKTERAARRNYGSVYEFEVVLEGIEPPIWRQIQVPECYSFWDLHVAIQGAMGWQNYTSTRSTLQ